MSHPASDFSSNTNTHALRQHFDSLALSENFGELCGLLCVLEPESAATLWRSYSDLYDNSDQAGQQLLNQMVIETQTSLYSEDFDFALLLPEDSDDLQMRVYALRMYCRGLLSGIGLSGLSSLEALEGDAHAFVKDVVIIAESGIDADNSEEDEANYAELSEYIRAGTMLIAHDASTNQTARTLH